MFQMKLPPDRHQCMHAFKHTFICTHAYVFYMWPKTTLKYIRQTTQQNTQCYVPNTIANICWQRTYKTKKKDNPHASIFDLFNKL